MNDSAAISSRYRSASSRLNPPLAPSGDSTLCAAPSDLEAARVSRLATMIVSASDPSRDAACRDHHPVHRRSARSNCRRAPSQRPHPRCCRCRGWQTAACPGPRCRRPRRSSKTEPTIITLNMPTPQIERESDRHPRRIQREKSEQVRHEDERNDRDEFESARPFARAGRTDTWPESAAASAPPKRSS